MKENALYFAILQLADGSRIRTTVSFIHTSEGYEQDKKSYQDYWCTGGVELISFQERVPRLGDLVTVTERGFKKWEDHARRSKSDPLQMKLTYRGLRADTPIEVYTGASIRIDPKTVRVDYEKGEIRIEGDDGITDYFVTYEIRELNE